MEESGEGGGEKRIGDRRNEDDRKRKSEAKVSFIRKYYPDGHSSPGGSKKLEKLATGGRRMTGRGSLKLKSAS